jgi:beta-1,4-mannosyl-glycoprotein beta-1,4-N-acetylglucosaminyltransferase
MKIIDCFTFYNELELLNYRLNVLNDYVDYFILVEATHTFIGNEKELIFEKNKPGFENFKDKIIHIIVNDFPYTLINNAVEYENVWKNENYQRICIDIGIKKLNLTNDDVIVISDLDEIPDPNVLKKIKNNELKIEFNSLEMDFYYYNLNSKIHEKWYKSKVLSYAYYKYITENLKLNCNDIRMNIQMNQPSYIIKNGGWHLSYFGNYQFIKNKIENFAHQEYNNEKITSVENIEEKINTCKDLFGRNDCYISKIYVKDNLYLPPKYNVYLQNFVLF